jgi:hypothetical protein
LNGSVAWNFINKNLIAHRAFFIGKFIYATDAISVATFVETVWLKEWFNLTELNLKYRFKNIVIPTLFNKLL